VIGPRVVHLKHSLGMKERFSDQQRQQLATAKAEGEAILAEALKQRARVPAVKARRTPGGEAFRCAMNLVTIDIASIERLLEELRRTSVLISAKPLLEGMRKRASSLPKYIDRALTAAEVMATEPEPEPIQFRAVPVVVIPEEEKAEPEFAGHMGLPKCAYHACNLPANPGRMYCGDAHRIKVAHENARARKKAAKSQD